MSTPEADLCPEPGLLSQFIEGALSKRERAFVTRHLSRCAKCRYAVSRVIEIEERERARLVPPSPVGLQWWLPVAAGVVIAVIGSWFLIRKWMPRHADPTARLVAMMPSGERTIEARVSGGFRWAPLHRPRGSSAPKSPEERLAMGAAGSVLRDVAGDDRPAARHAAARAYLIAGEPKAAVEIFGSLSRQQPDDPSVWSDFAAALYSDGVSRDDASSLQRALACADRALQLDPRMPEALFNRAIIIEQTRPPSETRDAWSNYLKVDSSDGWSREARERLGRF